MLATRPILRVGLTGGIASGKTTVAGFLDEMGAFILDADRIAHEAIDPGGSAHDEVVAHFGREILDGMGRIDRADLGRRVFADASARKTLNDLVHPRVCAEIDRHIDHYLDAGGRSPVAVVDAALLVETGIWRQYHRLIVVHCSRDSQIQRLLSRGGLTETEVEARIASQAPVEEKLAVANYAIDTDTTLKETRRQAEQIWGSLLRDFETEFGEPGVR